MPAPRKSEVLEKRSKALHLIVSEWRKNSESGSVTADRLAKEIGASKHSAKQIIHEVDEVFRHVRATLAGDSVEWGGKTHYEKSIGRNRELKQEIAERFADLIPSTPSIACSAGTTVTYCVRAINESGKAAHVVTNNLGIVQEWSGVEEGLDLTGGTYDPDSNALSGESVIQTFKALRCSIGLIGVSGVAHDGRLFVRHRWEAKYRAAIVESVSNAIYICTDIEKLTARDLWQFATIDEIATSKPACRMFLITNECDKLHNRSVIHTAKDTLKGIGEISNRLGKQRFELVTV